MAGVAGASRSAGAASAGSRRDHLSALPHTIFRRPKGRNMEGLGGTEGGDGGKGGAVWLGRNIVTVLRRRYCGGAGGTTRRGDVLTKLPSVYRLGREGWG